MSGLMWSRRTTQKVAEQLAQLVIHVSAKTACRLLKTMVYSLRTNRKSISSTEAPQRNEQFEYIAHLRQQHASAGQPIISVDTEKKELVGQFKNAGRSWELEPVEVNDHDFRSQAMGMAVPYGIYELLLNRGTNYISTSKTKSGLKVRAKLLKKAYKTGIKISKKIFAGLSLECHETLPQWIYTLKPQQNA